VWLRFAAGRQPRRSVVLYKHNSMHGPRLQTAGGGRCVQSQYRACCCGAFLRFDLHFTIHTSYLRSQYVLQYIFFFFCNFSS
jgi:hypothetical protein